MAQLREDPAGTEGCARGAAAANKEVRAGLIRKATIEQRLDLPEEREAGPYISKGRRLQAEGVADAKAHAEGSWHIQGKDSKRRCAAWGKWSEQGER